MPGKLEIKVGAVTFTGEGDEKWLSTQLDKLLEKIPELAKVAPHSAFSREGTNGSAGEGNAASVVPRVSGTLASFLRSKNATSNQVKKFLATALWLIDTQNKTRLTTTDVTKAIGDANQSRLSNPSDCLLKNIGKGLCEKGGDKTFFVTDEGRDNLK